MESRVSRDPPFAPPRAKLFGKLSGWIFIAPTLREISDVRAVKKNGRGSGSWVVGMGTAKRFNLRKKTITALETPKTAWSVRIVPYVELRKKRPVFRTSQKYRSAFFAYRTILQRQHYYLVL